MSIGNGSYHIVSQEYNMLLGVRPNGDAYAVAQGSGVAPNTVWALNVRQPSPLTVSFCWFVPHSTAQRNDLERCRWWCSCQITARRQRRT